MQFDIITIFPKIFDSYFSESILSRAQKKNLIKINIHNLRDYTLDKHSKVDDKPYGGGQGMILQVEPFYRAITSLKSKVKNISPKSKVKNNNSKSKIIMLTPAGKTLDQKMAMRLSKLDNIILLCGRYEGFDARIDKFVDEKISIGNYVLSGGELPAMVLVEAVTRLIPGVLGHEHSALDDTFSVDKDYVEYPQYTRPEKFQIPNPKQITNSKLQTLKTTTLSVPKVLLSGDHEKIEEWKKKHVKIKK
ncbi:MAG: tRNA (guanosine(37)-N1)-methyltransferase TrmD [Patescibacteria group bacterium]|jgi:tRNA (guanine37-N1)-methyltransferase